MSRIFLRLANGPIFILLACILLAVQSSLFISWPLNWLQPDLLIAMVIWAAMKRGFIEGGILALLVGHIAELHSSTPQGLFLSSYMAIFLGVRVVTRILVLPDFQAWIKLTLVSAIAWKLFLLLLLGFLDKAELHWRYTLSHILPNAVTTGLAGIWIYRLLDQLDRLTHKDARLEQRLADDLKLAENEGI